MADVGEQIAAKEMRKHVAWYIRGLPHSHKVREQVNHSRTAAELTQLLATYLETLERQGLDAFAPEPEAAGTEALRATG